MIVIHIEGNPGVAMGVTARSIREGLEDGVLAGAQYQEGILRQHLYATKRGRTGALARSFRTRLLHTLSSNEVSAGVLSSLVYAEIQDVGGVIKPRHQKMLAVPLRRLPVGKWPRDFGRGKGSELRLITSKKGNLLLAKVSKRGKITPYFVLKSQVRLRGSNYLQAAADQARPGVAEIVAERMNRRASEAG